MLALADDAALARLVIAAIAIPRRAHSRWLHDIASRIDPPRSRRAACPRGLERSPDAWYPADQVHHRRRSSMPPLRRRRHGPQPDRRRALELLAASRDGATEAAMRAHGFTVEQMVELVRTGLATATAERVVVGGRTIEVA
jgi:hypothetical protein